MTTLDALDDYRWCGHSVLLARQELPGQVTEEVLSRFGRTASAARRRYRSFIQDGFGQGRRDELVGIGIFRGNRALGGELQDARVLGDGDFVESITRRAEEDRPCNRMPLDRIIELVMTNLSVDEAELSGRARALRVANARGIICHMAFIAGHKGVEIARRLNISGPGVTIAVRRGKELIKGYPELASIVR